MEAVMKLRPMAGTSAVMTEEEFEAWCDEDVKAEYVDGEVIVHSPVSTRHSDAVWFIGYLLKTIVQQHDLGRVLGPEVQVRLRPGLRRVPDLLFVAKARADMIQPTLIEGAPDLIVEIVSPDSVERDWREKYLEYQTAGVGEYWVVDLEYQRMAVYCRPSGCGRSRCPMSWTWRARWVFFREQHRDFRSLRDFGSLTTQGSTMNNNVRLQNLRGFTVQIRRPSDETIVGTGIAVTMDGQVVTCAHVVEAALEVHPRQADGAEVGVYFPQARGGEEKARRARVAACFPQHDDDVVLLQLTDGPSPLAPEQIPVLGTAEMSAGHGFRSYGYRRLEKYIAGHAHGVILGCVECPEGSSLQADPVQLESKQINQGMSGAAVLDMERNLVVGIVSEFWLPPDYSPKDRDTAWAVNARVLSLEPVGLQLQDEPYPKRPAPEPKTDIEAARAAVAPDLGIAWNNAPAPLEEWVGREELLAAISRDWADPERRVTGLIGFGGEGKSSLGRQSVDNLLGKLATCPTPDGVFWWGFYTRPSVDEFFEAALNYLSGGRIDPRKVPSASVRAQVIGAMLGAGRYLFILDGLEVMQHQEGDRYGLLKSADLRQFLSYFAAPGHRSFCLITSRAPLLDLMEYTTYTHRDVTRLLPADGRALLRRVGVQGPDEALDRMVADWDGHALTLSLLGGYLADLHAGDVAHIGEIPPPTADEPRYERVHRVLRRYDEHLTEAERAFLTLFSAFRTPVAETAFDKVFRAPVDVGATLAVALPDGQPRELPLHAAITVLDDAAWWPTASCATTPARATTPPTR